jgi:hypothetical protein
MAAMTSRENQEYQQPCTHTLTQLLLEKKNCNENVVKVIIRLLFFIIIVKCV